MPTNSPRAHYAISEVALSVIQSYGTSQFEAAVRKFIAEQKGAYTVYKREWIRRSVPVRLASGTTVELSPGKHNQLQAAIIENFAPRFAPGAHLVYLGDTAKKTLYIDRERSAGLAIPITEHDKLPDIILYAEERNWLFLVEAVTSHGPMTEKRLLELEEMLTNCPAGRVFVSAFPDFATFRKYLKDIAWETEVWIADTPDHLIHFNGEQFLGPYSR